MVAILHEDEIVIHRNFFIKARLIVRFALRKIKGLFIGSHIKHPTKVLTGRLQYNARSVLQSYRLVLSLFGLFSDDNKVE